jgi:CheY-like chemotaxis protein
MKVETRCASCGSSFLIDEEGGSGTPCPVCGSPMEKEASALEPAPATNAPVAALPTPPEPERSDDHDTAPRPIGAVEPDADEVVCPRCKLHFVPRAVTAPEAASSSKQTVLVVEDMEYFIEIARDALEPRYQVKVATTVEDARALLGAGNISLMLLDLTLAEGGDAGQLLGELPFKPCPILIYTAEDESTMYGETWEKLQDLGADDVVLKGMNVGESIVRKVDSLLGGPGEDSTSGA